MSNVKSEVVSANRDYAAGFGEKSQLASPPARRFAILTCMDARLDPAKFAGFAEGDAHVIRNAGGRASDDAIRSLVISHKLLGTNEWFVVHHTGCGMETFTNEIMGSLLAESIGPATHTGDGWQNTSDEPGADAGKSIDWLTIGDPTQSIIDDVERIKNHPLVPPYIRVYGYMYEVKTGALEEIIDTGAG